MISPARANASDGDRPSAPTSSRPPTAITGTIDTTVSTGTTATKGTTLLTSPAPAGWPTVLPPSARADLPRGIPQEPTDPPSGGRLGGALVRPSGAVLPGAAPGAPDCSLTPCVALTFDDGPGPSTERLLDMLARDRVPATFFVIGRQIAGQEALLARMVRDGHVVGNHTWSHPSLARITPEATRDQVGATDAAILAATGVRPSVMRPPYGAMSPTATQVGQAVILWDVDTLDWKYRVSSSVTERALAGARSGSIVLMHDIHPSTVDAVPAIVAGLRARGYTLVTVPQLLGQMRAGAVYTRR